MSGYLRLTATVAALLCVALARERRQTSNVLDNESGEHALLLADCPVHCVCKGFNVDCSDHDLKLVPRIPANTRRLDSLSQLELLHNPIRGIGKDALTNLHQLKKLVLSSTHSLSTFPDLSNSKALEHLRVHRGKIELIPPTICEWAPKLKSFIIKSNRIRSLPILDGCTELKLIDLSYNEIVTLGDEPMFSHQSKLIDLFLGHNALQEIPVTAFQGLVSLQVLELENNDIHYIHPDAFAPLAELRDLNLGRNSFPTLPTKGLQNLRRLKTHNNPALKEFPEPETFPKIHTLALSYAYHCCSFLPLKLPPTHKPPSLQDAVLWLQKEDIDMSLWNSNNTDLWPTGSDGAAGAGGNSTKLADIVNNLWKTYGKDYQIPDNLAQYAEEYFEDYKSQYGNSDDSLVVRYPVQCLPQPGPFMPCEDLFGWWTLRCGVWVVFLMALLGNGVVVIVLLFGRSKMDVPRFLVCNLAVADFFMGVYLGILALVDTVTLDEFKAYAIPWQTSWGCQLAGFLGVLSSELSVYTLAVITLERNYAITHAMHLNKRLSLKHASYIMTGGWTFALTMALLPLFGISDYRKFAVCLPFEIENSSVWLRSIKPSM